MKKILGKKVVAIKTYCGDKRKKRGFVPEYILFDDKKTIMKFEEQDYYTYHDCCSFAKIIDVIEDSELWNNIMTNEMFRDSDKEF